MVHSDGSARTMAEDRQESVVRPDFSPEDLSGPVRPRRLADFVGQSPLRNNLETFISAARQRGTAMDHALFHGPPGLGKTTLAHIAAAELDVNIRITSGPALVRAGDLASVLTNLESKDVLFIDEIHRLGPAVEETLYPALEEYELDLVLGQGPAARAVRIALQPFTLIGATTRLGLVSTPLRDRFGIHLRLEFYGVEELAEILMRAASRMGCPLGTAGAAEISRRSRGVPRVAIRLLRRIADFAEVERAPEIGQELADRALRALEVDEMGLDSLDRRYLNCLAEHYDGGPAGIETLAAALAETRDALEDVVEPFLLQRGYLQRTPRGRLLTRFAWERLGRKPPNRQPEHPRLPL